MTQTIDWPGLIALLPFCMQIADQRCCSSLGPTLSIFDFLAIFYRMPRRYDSKFAAFLEKHIPDADEMDLQELSSAIGPISLAMLSRLRSGTQDVGAIVARRIADRLGETESEKSRLLEELLATRTSSVTAITAEALMQSDGLRGWGFFVFFGEKPAMSLETTGPETTRLIARWLNAGLTYAMLVVQPEPRLEAPAEDVASEQNSGSSLQLGATAKHLRSVYDAVVESYLSLRAEALRQLADSHGFSSEHDFAPEAILIDQRLRLYEFAHSELGPYTPTGFKIQLKGYERKYVRFDWSTKPILGNEHPQDRLLERDSDKTTIDSIRAFFFPIVTWFEELSFLPSNKTELAEIAKAFPRPGSLRRSEHPWQLYEQPEEATTLWSSIHEQHREQLRLKEEQQRKLQPEEMQS